MNPLTINQIEREIENLIASFPELADDETLRADVVEGQTDAPAILARIVDRMLDAEAMASAIKTRIECLESRQKKFDRQGDAMRVLALRIMNAAQVRKMPLPDATLSISTRPGSVMITDQTALPSRFLRTRMEPNKTAIKEALEQGEQVPGAFLANGAETLSVRAK